MKLQWQVTDLAAKMVRLSGLTPVFSGDVTKGQALQPGEIEISFTELRPGENSTKSC
jgi:FlaA1/EpsC-like NDP-sugar epimerase